MRWTDDPSPSWSTEEQGDVRLAAYVVLASLLLVIALALWALS